MLCTVCTVMVVQTRRVSRPYSPARSLRHTGPAASAAGTPADKVRPMPTRRVPNAYIMRFQSATPYSLSGSFWNILKSFRMNRVCNSAVGQPQRQTQAVGPLVRTYRPIPAQMWLREPATQGPSRVSDLGKSYLTLKALVTLRRAQPTNLQGFTGGRTQLQPSRPCKSRVHVKTGTSGSRPLHYRLQNRGEGALPLFI